MPLSNTLLFKVAHESCLLGLFWRYLFSFYSSLTLCLDLLLLYWHVVFLITSVCRDHLPRTLSHCSQNEFIAIVLLLLGGGGGGGGGAENRGFAGGLIQEQSLFSSNFVNEEHFKLVQYMAIG